MKRKQLYYLHQLSQASCLNDYERDFVLTCYNLIAADFTLSVKQKKVLRTIVRNTL